MHLWTSWRAVFSVLPAPMAVNVTMDTATEERCFLCGPCLDAISRTISELSGVQWREVSWLVRGLLISVVVSCCC
jgi:hypothetical protein